MFTGNENHVITLEEAAKLTKNYRQTLMVTLGGFKAGAFEKSAVELVLNQNGVVGIRIYMGLSDDLVPTPQFVIVGVDVLGNDVTAGVVLDRSLNCPNFCPAQARTVS